MTEKKSLWQIGYSGAPVVDAPLTYLDAQVGRDGDAITFPLQAVGRPANGIMFPLMPIEGGWEDCVWSDSFEGVDYAPPSSEKWEGDLDAFYILDNEAYFEGIDGTFELVSKGDYSTDFELIVKLNEHGFDETIDYPSGDFGVNVGGYLFEWSKDIYDMGTLACNASFDGEAIDCAYGEIWVSIVRTGSILDVSYSVDFGGTWNRTTYWEDFSFPESAYVGIVASGYGGWDFSAAAFQVMEGCPE